MTITHPLNAEFNPMLAVSVFGHLFFLSVFMFLPQAKVIMEKIEPVFMVDLVELPGGLIEAPEPPAVPRVRSRYQVKEPANETRVSF